MQHFPGVTAEDLQNTNKKTKFIFNLKISSYQRPVEKSRRTTAPEEIFSENLKSYKGGGGGWATVYLCGKVVCRAWSFH